MKSSSVEVIHIEPKPDEMTVGPLAALASAGVFTRDQVTAAFRRAVAEAEDDERCPQGCPASVLEDPQPGTAAHNAAIVAEVKTWLA
jgi:hypothetical protein